MDYRMLGRTGVRVSQLCFGAMSFGGDADEAMSARMYRACATPLSRTPAPPNDRSKEQRK